MDGQGTVMNAARVPGWVDEADDAEAVQASVPESPLPIGPVVFAVVIRVEKVAEQQRL